MPLGSHALAGLASAVIAAQQGAATAAQATAAAPVAASRHVTAKTPGQSELPDEVPPAGLPLLVAAVPLQLQLDDKQRQMDSTSSLLKAETESARLRAAMASSRQLLSPVLRHADDTTALAQHAAGHERLQDTLPVAKLGTALPAQSDAGVPVESMQDQQLTHSHSAHVEQQAADTNEVIIVDRSVIAVTKW